jgi:sugar phosphate isomerase/epimerase
MTPERPASRVAVSAYSVREHLGPAALAYTDPRTGLREELRFDFPRLLRIDQFPARARAEFEVRGIEVCQSQFAGPDADDVGRLGTALADSGMDLVNIAIDSGDLLASDRAARHRDIETHKRWISRFAALGSRFVRVNAGSPLSQRSLSTVPESLVDALSELGEFANANGTRLLVENHGGPSSEPVWMERLLTLAGHELVGLLLVIGNCSALAPVAMATTFGGGFDQSSLDLEPAYAAIEKLSGRAELVHLKAHAVDEHQIGPLDLGRAIRILRDGGYAGVYTVEYEGVGGDPWAKTRRVAEAARSALVPPST